jgi:hypothetical protein
VQPVQPDTPASEPPPAGAIPIVPPLDAPKRPRRVRRDPAEIAREAARTKRIVRAALATIALALTGVFVAAARIRPYDAAGNPLTMGTHTQLGMEPCNFVVLTGKPCPACGMTTSFALLVRGDVGASLRANWVGTVICVSWALALVWAAAGAVRGKPLFVPRGRGEMVFTIAAGAVLVLMLARWGVILLSG